MAAANVVTKKLIWNKGEEYAATAVDTTDGAFLTPGNDEATLIVLTSSAAVTATITGLGNYTGSRTANFTIGQMTFI